MYQCEFCSASFPSYYSLRSHKNGSTTDGVPKCALVLAETINVSPDSADDVSMHSAVADIKTSIFLQHEICQRHQMHAELGSPKALTNIGLAADTAYTGSIDYGALVTALECYCVDLLNSRATKFWQMYLATRHLSQEDQKEILRKVRKLFLRGQKKGWCVDKRVVRNLMNKKTFWPLVTYSYTCDLGNFGVPGLGSVTYKFNDPIFTWILQARKLCEKFHLVFRYREATKKTSGEQTWGSCVSCGGAMRQVTYPRILF